MKEIWDYVLVSANRDGLLRELVIKGIKEGMQPFGSPFVSLNSVDNRNYYQTMVKYKED